MITIDDYLMGRGAGLSDELLANAAETVQRYNMVLSYFYVDRQSAAKVVVRSGYRTPEINASTPGAAPASKHMTCQALDGSDAERTFARWCVTHQDVLTNVEMWMEDPRATPGWVHLQTVPPHSGSRIFIPDANWAARLSGHPLTEAL